jgi:hypothetical protein
VCTGSGHVLGVLDWRPEARVSTFVDDCARIGTHKHRIAHLLLQGCVCLLEFCAFIPQRCDVCVLELRLARGDIEQKSCVLIFAG